MNENTATTEKPLSYVNIAFLTLTPLIALSGVAIYTYLYGITWLEITNFFFMYFITGLSITGGYHRYFSHKSYECSKPLQILYLLFGAAAVENSVLNWCSDHRNHHTFVDKEEDPYNILKGGLYAHIGWVLYKDTLKSHEKQKNIPDLLRNPLVVWQDRYYLPLVILFGFVVPTLIGWMGDRPMGGLLWGGFLRVVVVQHMTFFINSLAHLYGTRPYCEDNTARDNWWLGPLTFGEGYHNFHHKFHGDFRNGYRWYQFDLTKWWLYVMRSVGLAWKFKKTPDIVIFRARLEMQFKRLQSRLSQAQLPKTNWDNLHTKLDQGRKQLELAVSRYHQARSEYSKQKKEWSEQMRSQWQAKLKSCKEEYTQAQRSWNDLMQTLEQQLPPTAVPLSN